MIILDFSHQVSHRNKRISTDVFQTPARAAPSTDEFKKHVEGLNLSQMNFDDSFNTGVS